MAPRLVRIANAAVERLVNQEVARENARAAASALAQCRVDRMEVEHYLQQQVRGGRRPHLHARRGALR